MVAKMLRAKLSHERFQQFIRWFKATAAKIEPRREELRKHLLGVIPQLQTNLQEASRENPHFDKNLLESLTASVQKLHNKASIPPSANSSNKSSTEGCGEEDSGCT